MKWRCRLCGRRGAGMALFDTHLSERHQHLALEYERRRKWQQMSDLMLRR